MAENDNPRSEKKVDEAWKDQIEKEKQTAGKQGPEKKARRGKTAMEANFASFASSLGMQAMIFLGDIENPVTRKKEVVLDQAKYMIDVLGMLQEKTAGNLSDDENALMEDLLYQLRTRYVARADKVPGKHEPAA